MAGASLLTLLDDIATLLDDVAVMTKLAAKKTAGVLGDDLALNAEQVSGIKADRELPVVWAVAKGSLLNKLILVPAALAISAFIPWLITPLLMIGGAFLCYEGFEKVMHKLFHEKEEEQHHGEMVKALSDPKVDMVQFERDKVKGAIRTDFILSAEIIVIALGTAKDAEFAIQAGVVSVVAVLITLIVYGLVATIVRMDDVGLHLIRGEASDNEWISFRHKLGHSILGFAPVLMKTLTIVGTAAMFLVGGGIIAHGISTLHHFVEHSAELAEHSIPSIGGIIGALTPTVMNGLIGVIVGGILVVVISLGTGLFGGKAKQEHV